MLIGRTSGNKTLSSTARLLTVSHSVSVVSTIRAIGAKSRLMEWEMGDKGRIYSLFRWSIRIAALSSPSTFPIKNIKHRMKALASFGNPEGIRVCSQVRWSFPPPHALLPRALFLLSLRYHSRQRFPHLPQYCSLRSDHAPFSRTKLVVANLIVRGA